MIVDPLVTVFIGVVAAAFLIQSLALVGIHRTMRSISARVDALTGDIHDKLSTVSTNVADLVSTIRPTVEQIHQMQQNFTATSEIIHRRVEDLDVLAQDFTDIARQQLVRIQDVAETTSKKIEETAEFLQQGLLTPVNEIAAILRGLRAGFGFLFRGKGLSPQRPHQDEEMFI